MTYFFSPFFFFSFFDFQNFIKYVESNKVVQLNRVSFPGLNNSGIFRFRYVRIFLFRNRNVIWRTINKTQCLNLSHFQYCFFFGSSIIPATEVKVMIYLNFTELILDTVINTSYKNFENVDSLRYGVLKHVVLSAVW